MPGGREILRINPVDAAARGIEDGDVVRVYNDRGACLAAANVTDAMMQGVVTLPTGAWFRAEGWGREGLEQNGNPNVVTRDIGTSSLAQGPSAQSCRVEVARHGNR
jgi:biotin/methionine sulfoxide reductase